MFDPDRTEPTMMLTHSTRPWASAVHRYLADHGGAVVAGYAVSPESATDAEYDILMLDDITSFISPLLVTRLQQRGTKVIGVYDPADGGESGALLLSSFGVDVVVSADTSVVDLVAMVGQLGPPRDELGSEDKPKRVESSGTSTGARQLIAVVGAAGGCGSTEVAISFTGAASRYSPTVLIDGDTQRPSIAQRLDLSVHPNLLTAIDRTLHNESVAGALTFRRDLDAHIIGGIPDPSRWTAVRPGELTELLAVLRAERSIVINVASEVEQLPGAGMNRFGVTRAVVALADSIVLVATADPVGVRRATEWLAESRQLRLETPVHLLLNRCPFGPTQRRALEAEVSRSHVFASVRAAGHDRRLSSAAWRGGTATRGSLARSARRIAFDVVGRQQP